MKKILLVFTALLIVTTNIFSVNVAAAESVKYSMEVWNGDTPNYFVDMNGLTGTIAECANGNNAYFMRVADTKIGYLRCAPTLEFECKQPMFKLNTAVAALDLSKYSKVIIKWAVNDEALVGKKSVVKITSENKAETSFDLPIDRNHVTTKKDWEFNEDQNFNSTTIDLSGFTGKLTDMTFLPFYDMCQNDETWAADAHFYVQSIEFVEVEAVEEPDSPATADYTAVAVAAVALAGAVLVLNKKKIIIYKV